MRILHLIDPQSPECGPCVQKHVSDFVKTATSVNHLVWTVGRGLKSRDRISRNFSSSIQSIRKLIQHQNRKSQPINLIHAWSPTTGVYASLVSRTIPEIVSIFQYPLTRIQDTVLIRAARRRTTHFIASSELIQNALASCGFSRHCIRTVVPAVTDNMFHAGSKIRMSNSSSFVIGLLSEPSQAADARPASIIAARLKLSGRNVKLFIHPKTSFRSEARHFLAKIGFQELLVVDEGIERPWEFASTLHAALYFNSRHTNITAAMKSRIVSMLPALWTQAAGIPIVAEENMFADEPTTPNRSTFTIPKGDLDAAADCMAKLYDDSLSQSKKGVNEKKNTADTESFANYVAQVVAVYQSIVHVHAKV